MFNMSAILNDPQKMGLLQLGASLLQSSGGDDGRRIGIGEALGRAIPQGMGGAAFGNRNKQLTEERERLKKEREAIQKQMAEARQFMQGLQGGAAAIPQQPQQALPQMAPGRLPPNIPRLPQDLLDQELGGRQLPQEFMTGNAPRGLPQMPNAGGLPPGKMYPWA